MSQQHDQKSKQTTKRINTGNNTTPIHAYIFLPLAPAYIHAYLLTNIYIYAGVYVDNHAYAYTCVSPQSTKDGGSDVSCALHLNDERPLRGHRGQPCVRVISSLQAAPVDAN